jgi:hypothetical protein
MMNLTAIHCFLVHPVKNDAIQPDIAGASVPASGRLYDMLQRIFGGADLECPSEIVFRPNAQRQQQNDCRDILLAYVRGAGIDTGRELAERLQKVTTHRSKLGLLVLMLGIEGGFAKVVLSWFPADEGILAEQSAGSLSVQFLEKVFVKSLFSYKAAAYNGDPQSSSAFWMGRAIDKQIMQPGELAADYWIKEFLASDFRTTSAAGSMRIAEAFHAAIRDAPDLATKQELMAAATLASNLGGRTVSGASLSETFGLTEAADEAFTRAFKGEALAQEQFQFDAEEFRKHAPLRSVEVDNGATLTAATSDFDTVFKREESALKGKLGCLRRGASSMSA